MPELIDRDWIKANAAGTFKMHMRTQNVSVYQREVIDKRTGQPIGLSYTDTIYKHHKSNGADAGRTIRTWFVGEHQWDGDIEPALDRLNAQRREAA